MDVQKPTKRANCELTRGINAISANRLAKMGGDYGRVFAHSSAKCQAKAEKTLQHSTKKWYPTDFIPKPLPSAKTRRNSIKTAKLRKSITPGTVLILLSGRFRGKRVVFLRQLPSGTLLVTGPYKVNGVPLRRVNQAYVIATSTRMDLSDVELPKIDDSYFVKDKQTSKEKCFFAAQLTPTSAVITEQRKKDQKTVDALLMKKLANEPYLRAYLNAKFTLTKNDCAHDMRF
ncbi:unnamed protein product [Peronospora destructor]|uniref:60S ribosomal protein L6 n=1 Tax=Peronospora destructor TaxID=86335 RepID=A0AAV0VCR0_9STRA|nr:unnamed protein product [Peronospora destructor]